MRKTAIRPAGRSAGFSLIELMIALAIVVIIAAVALPNMTGFVKRSNRTDGTKALIALSTAQEQYYMANQTYANAIALLRVPTLTEDDHYLLSVVSGDAARYTLQADPNGAGTSGTMKDDGKFRLNSVGVKTWDCKNDASYSCDWETAVSKNN